jgi:serine/threonine-protein kinase
VPTQQIGEELSVDYVLEGTVRWEREPTGESRVRITPQLIRVSDDTHLWTERYSAVLAGVFQIQADVAGQVADALEITLLDAEREALEVKPTENTDAYVYYLRGNEYFFGGRQANNLQLAVRMFEAAIEADPDFALAYAHLSRVHESMYWWFYDRTDQRLEGARRAAERALELEPDLREGHVAIAYYYYHGLLDYARALASFSKAREVGPDDFELLAGIAAVHRRRGQWAEAAANYERAIELDPLNGLGSSELGITSLRMREYEKAARSFDRRISMAPDVFEARWWRAVLHIAAEGDRESALKTLEEVWSLSGRPELYASNEPWLWSIHRIIGPDYESALERLSAGTFGTDTASYFLTRAELYELLGERDGARAYYDSARVVLERLTTARPDEARFHSELGVAYAGLGRSEDAIREGQEAVEILPTSKDAYDGTDWLLYLARIYVMVGDYDAAIDGIEHLLSVPGVLSREWLHVDPIWDPLRDHPRFQRLVRPED